MKVNSFCEGLQRKIEHCYSEGSVSDSKSRASGGSSSNKGSKNSEVKIIKQ